VHDTVNLDVSELDMMPAAETTGEEPQLISSCCSHCFSSLLLVTNGCD
jgi:hypothetical protein